MGSVNLFYYGLLALSMLAALVGGVLRKFYSQKNGLSVSGGFWFNAICTLIAALLLLYPNGMGQLSTYTILMGILFGILTAVQGVTSLLALELGPMSYTTVLISFSTIISALSGVLFFHESLSVAQIIGFVLMIICCALAVSKEETKKPATLGWLGLCLVAFLATGFIGIMQKVHQNSAHKAESGGFLILAFLASALLSIVFALLFARREKKTVKKNSKATLLLLVFIMIGCGVCTAVNNKLNLMLSGIFDSAFFFPVVNGGGVVLTTLAALMIFRERLSKKQWLGMFFGVLSIIMLCNPFG